jgi:GTP cyclohydrolase II
MTLTPTVPERLARARADLRAGVPVVVGDVLVVAAEVLSAGRLGDFRELGAPVVVLTERRAETLKARCYDGDIARISVPEDVSVGWVTALADPSGDLGAPMKGPLISIRGGDAVAHRAAITLIKEARLLPAALAVDVPEGLAAEHGLTQVSVDEIGQARGVLQPVVSANVPLSVSEAGRLHVFRPDDGGEEHYAVEIGRPDRAAPVLARLHSACFTGDLLGSLKCDCGPQLRGALAAMGVEGAGVLLYLNQEGRGIGLANKMRAYSLQDQGFDTVEANHRLGFEDDERDFEIGARILTALGFGAVRLLTNNPAKVDMMNANGIEVTERVPLKVGENPLNEAYLATKARKSGHIL